MRWGCDEEKSRRNTKKHGVPLELAPKMFDGVVYEATDDREEYDEARMVAIGMIEGRFFVCVYAVHDDEAHVISLRKATRRERERYVKKVFG